ncbi:MAG: biotin/lipoyl-binding protein, partial [Chloroflexi bacterium]|nr:biotin/lipoyl-binding protein [Chloroflexota bacterium]
MAPKKRPVWPIAVAIVVIVLIVAAVMRPRNSAPAPTVTAPSAPPVPVSAAIAGQSSMTRTIPVIGQLQSNDVVSLTSKIAGKIVRLNVTAGDQVTAGEVVAELDPSDEVNQLHQAQAALALAQTKYEQLRTGQGLKNTQTAQGISSAQANLNAARAHLSQLITAARIEDTTAAEGVQQARANLVSSQQNLAQVQEGARTQERAQAQTAVERARADYTHAQADFNRTD